MDAPFQQALSRFKIGLTDSEVADFQFSSLDNVYDAIEEIQRHQKASKAMRNLNRVKPFLEAMDQYGKVIEVFLNTSGFVAFIWVCRAFSIWCVRGYGNSLTPT